MKKQKIAIFYQEMVNSTGRFQGFLTGSNGEDIKKKAKKFRLRPHGNLIKEIKEVKESRGG